LVAEDVEVIDLKTSDIQGVIEAYRRATVFVAPLEGPGGTRLKILGAMAAGVPVVTTKVGIEGIEAKDGEEVLIADNPRLMAYKVIELILDKKFYEKIVGSARKLVEQKYSYRRITSILEKFYREITNVHD
jgi:glycosyltransferase involved in cell wall biosynthesis